MIESSSAFADSESTDLDDQRNFPPTLFDLESNEAQHAVGKALSFIEEKLQIPNAWFNRQYLGHLLRSAQSHPALLDSSPSEHYHDIYICTAPRNGIGLTLNHWSLYTQGCFFHLRNKKTPRLDTLDYDSIHELDTMLEQIQRDVALSRFHIRGKYQASSDKNSYYALVIFHVGQTRFSLETIKTISCQVMSSFFNTYSFHDMNCQMFIRILMERIVMTKREGAVFIGTKAQVANWDLRLKARGERPYSQEHGYLIHEPASGRFHFHLAK